MSKTYLPYDPDQQLLLPAALQEWLPPDHLTYFISDVVDQLDLSVITARYEEERRGGSPLNPCFCRSCRSTTPLHPWCADYRCLWNTMALHVATTAA